MHRTHLIVRGSAAAAAAMLASAAFAGTPSATLSINASGSYKLANGAVPADTFVVNVNVADMGGSGAVGAQFRVNYDSTKVDLVGVAAGIDFPLVIYSNTATAGVITMATGVNGGSTGIAAGNIAQLSFKPKTVLCGSDLGAAFATSGFTNKISNSSGGSMPFTTAVNASVNGLGAFSITGTPGSVSAKPCDAGALSAVVAAVSGSSPAAQDSCGNALNVVLRVNGNPGSMPSAFPIGTTSLSWTATDSAGNTDTTTASVQVDDRQRIIIEAALGGTSAGNSTRSTSFSYSGASAAQTVSIAMVNNQGAASGSSEVDIAPAIVSSPACASLKDTLHSLRNTQAGFGISGTKWTVNFGSLTQGDSNDDNLVDILDFGMYVGDFSGTAAAAARSNFDGDTDVDTGDYTFISGNFFATGASCASAWQGQPLASVTLKQLRRMGMGDLAVADINRDGRVDQADIVAFMQGQRVGQATRNAGAGNAAE
jgi:hypothetical protein